MPIFVEKYLKYVLKKAKRVEGIKNTKIDKKIPFHCKSLYFV